MLDPGLALEKPLSWTNAEEDPLILPATGPLHPSVDEYEKQNQVMRGVVH